MIPSHHTPTSSGTNQHNPADDAAERIHRNQEKTQLENRLRVMKNDIIAKQRSFNDFERDVRALEMSIDHIDGEIGRVEGEYKRLTQEVQKTETETKTASYSYREKDAELKRKEDEVRKVEHEISLLKADAAEKERKIILVKQDISKLMKEKEDFRRENELGHFSALTEGGHAREKGSRIQILNMDKKRKEAEVVRKKQMMSETRRYIIDHEQDVMQLDAKIRRLSSGG